MKYRAFYCFYFILYSTALHRTWTVQYPRQLLHCIVKPQHITVLQQYFKSSQYSKGTTLFIQSVLHGTTISSSTSKSILHSLSEEKSSSWYEQLIFHSSSPSSVLQPPPFDCMSTHSALFLYKVCTSASTVFWYFIRSTESALDLHPSKVKNVQYSPIVLL